MANSAPRNLWHQTAARTPRHIVVVACGATKRSEASAAKDLYTGRHFQLCRQYAEQNGDAWAILSAKHLVLHPDQVIEPYNVRMPTGKRQIELPGGKHFRMAMWLNLYLHVHERGGIHFEVLAGRDYVPAFTHWGRRQFLSNATFSFPLAGMGIGQQDQWLQAALNRHHSVG